MRPLLVSLIVFAVLAAAGGWVFVWPPTDRPGRVDAVLVLAGGRGEREAAGIRMAWQGVAPVIVFSDGGKPGSAAARQCRRRLAGIRIVCLSPHTSSTRGEARAFAELADREGWRSVAVVTSSYHVRRASLLVERCYGGMVHTVAAAPSRGYGPELVRSVLRESAALVALRTFRRGC